jgi:hypothetical protein
MADAIFAILEKLVHSRVSFLVETWTSLRDNVFTKYHPEQHYMRGPGPKWRKKHLGTARESLIRSTRLGSLGCGQDTKAELRLP